MFEISKALKAQKTKQEQKEKRTSEVNMFINAQNHNSPYKAPKWKP